MQISRDFAGGRHLARRLAGEITGCSCGQFGCNAYWDRREQRYVANRNQPPVDVASADGARPVRPPFWRRGPDFGLFPPMKVVGVLRLPAHASHASDFERVRPSAALPQSDALVSVPRVSAENGETSIPHSLPAGVKYTGPAMERHNSHWVVKIPTNGKSQVEIEREIRSRCEEWGHNADEVLLLLSVVLYRGFLRKFIPKVRISPCVYPQESFLTRSNKEYEDPLMPQGIPFKSVAKRLLEQGFIKGGPRLTIMGLKFKVSCSAKAYDVPPTIRECFENLNKILAARPYLGDILRGRIVRITDEEFHNQEGMNPHPLNTTSKGRGAPGYPRH